MTTPAVTLNTLKPKEETFQVFKSARISTRLITPKGFRITFTGFEYATQNQEAIEYLNDCIKSYVPGISYKGEATSSDLNPAEALRKKHIAEYEADKAKIAAAVKVPAPATGAATGALSTRGTAS